MGGVFSGGLEKTSSLLFVESREVGGGERSFVESRGLST